MRQIVCSAGHGTAVGCRGVSQPSLRTYQGFLAQASSGARSKLVCVCLSAGNPEEGELRPQLLDRFGMHAQVRRWRA